MLNMDPGVCVLILYNQSKRNSFGFYCWGKNIFIYLSPENESGQLFKKNEDGELGFWTAYIYIDQCFSLCL